MPHLDEHLTFPIDKLSIQAVDYNSESPQDTVYVVPVTIHAEQGYGAELEGIGDGANVEVYLSLRYKFGIWDDELGQYRNQGTLFNKVSSLITPKQLMTVKKACLKF